MWEDGLPNFNAKEFARPWVELCWWWALSRKYDSKRRRKWARRILLAKTIKEITLTCVIKNKRYNKNAEEEIWLCVQDIFDHWNANRGGTSRRIQRGRSKYDMTVQEAMNRLRPLLNSDFMSTSFRDTTNTLGITTRRYRITYFRVVDMNLLDQYIEYCETERLKI